MSDDNMEYKGTLSRLYRGARIALIAIAITFFIVLGVIFLIWKSII